MEQSHSPNNIMNQPSFLQVLRKVQPVPCLDLLRKASPLLLTILHALNIFLCNPSLLLEACAGLGQCGPICVRAQWKGRCGEPACSGWNSASQKVAVWRSTERHRLWPHGAGNAKQRQIAGQLDSVWTRSSGAPRFFSIKAGLSMFRLLSCRVDLLPQWALRTSTQVATASSLFESLSSDSTASRWIST